MQCIQSTSLHNILRGKALRDLSLPHHFSRDSSSLLSQLSISSYFSLHRSFQRRSVSSTVSRYAQSLAYASPSPPFTEPHDSQQDGKSPRSPSSNARDVRGPSSSPTRPPGSQALALSLQASSPSLTPAQISRAASQAIRISCARRQHFDALYIINSLRESIRPDGKKLQPILNKSFPRVPFYPVKFGKAVSPVLASHCLLHHYLRSGRTTKARKFSEQLMREGIPIKSKTLHFVIQAQLHTMAPPPPQEKILSRQMSHSLEGLLERPTAIRDKSLRYSTLLLLQAHQHRQRFQDETAQMVINACLFQGELLVGCLVFVVLVKGWLLRQQAAAHFKAEIATQEGKSGGPALEGQTGWENLATINNDPPPRSMLNELLKHYEVDLLQHANQPTRIALQMLANLAGSIDRRELPYDEISKLLRVLYSVPKVHDTVWVVENGIEKQVQAYTYIHAVLDRLVRSPPTTRARRHQNYQGLLPLSVRSYNSLLHYALRHQYSVELATQLLDHMEHKRRPPLKPNTSTYNILVRAGTLIRHNDVSKAALEALRIKTEHVQNAISAGPPSSQKNEQAGPIVPSDPLPSEPLATDAHTLSSYILHLTSTGRPAMVAQVLFQVLPELSIIDHPSWGDVTREQRDMMRLRTREERLKRAVSLGPHFFTAVLNALTKAGKTGLAERVWLLAKQAERASWLWAPEGQPVKAWCLPVHAYTIMLQCYGAEARKANRGVRRSWDLSGDDAAWTPKHKVHVRGWAHYVLSRKVQGSSRRQTGLRMSACLYRAMFRGARNIMHSLGETLKLPAAVELPQPDARFFNAALDIFDRNLSTCRKMKNRSFSGWKAKLRRAKLRFVRRGQLVRGHNPFLVRICHDMVSAGYKLPVGLKVFMIGRTSSVLKENQGTVAQLPVGHPSCRREAFKPWALATEKTRGMHIRRREWRSHGAQWKRQCRRTQTKHRDVTVDTA
ncbi:hypothetical protein CONPUDRAFT_81713 [Coniophora puteana RWD-64-598 SS2]|uniref:Uncharacterized protein n=1 Tax=Coniophora puteana (strain RWD-64-598) TaxID=741705 RepID=A0A5M3MSU6_CONPW|nr:uncharacterized protein CONPUDRAFT_81713 [Coniophora puteana RWD-64-598 SS2]EIW82170.1 hypothetical protein CONPUDRAFT_81713 [Coniophora puteana RWD-64-598 SS2]